MQASEEDKKQIQLLTNRIVDCLSPYGVRQVYLFGSFAYGKPTADSDFDFYVVVRDENKDLINLGVQALSSTRGIKKRPVDILVGNKSLFERRRQFASIESEVYRKGMLLYEA